jgi:hypothetical protein
MFSLQKIGEQEVRKVSYGSLWGVVEVAQTMYTHVSKCKNDKTKNFKKRMYVRYENGAGFKTFDQVE